MKQILGVLLLASVQFVIGQKEITSASTINDVTVFLSSAEVHRTAKVTLSKGSNLITFEKLSPYMIPNSIQVKAISNNVTIVSVNQQNNYLVDESNDDRLEEIENELENLNLKKRIREGHRNVYNEEKSLMLTNKSITSSEHGVLSEDLMDMADLFRERLMELETKMLDIQLELSDIEKKRKKLVNQKNELSRGKAKQTKEVVVNCSSGNASNVTFEISYVVSQASWIPRYDIRCDDISKPIALNYKADVYNASGYDWENVNITLSTGNPSVDNTQPELNPFYVSYYKKSKNKYKRKSGVSYAYGAPRTRAAAPSFEESADMEDSEVSALREQEKSITLANFTSEIQNAVNTEFIIDFPYTIKSDGKANLVEIKNHDVPVDFQYLTIPKKDKDAFLLARLSGWGQYNLLPGEANVYFEGTYVGQSFLETASTSDTLDVSMGRDQGIVVTREKVNEYCKNSTFGGTKKTARAYEISVRNNKNEAVEIEIRDQIPLSRTKDVEVELQEKSDADYNEATGELIWKLKIPAGSTQKVSFKFNVKYPKNFNLNNI